MLPPNHLFTPEQLAVLLAPECWALVGAAGLAEPPPVTDRAHRRWLADNAHAHGHAELCVVLAGEGCHGCSGTLYALAPGTVFYFGPFTAHDQVPPPHMRFADQLWFSMVKDTVVARLLEVRDGSFGFGGKWSVMLTREQLGCTDCRTLLEGLEQEELPAALRRLKLRAAAATLVAALVGAGYRREEQPSAESFQGQVIAMICGHIQESAGRGETLGSLARLAGYSRFHFLRLFKQHTGRSVHEYIDECRLRRVREWQAAGFKQARIAEQLGFSSPSVFARWYRAYREGPGPRSREGDET